MICDSCQRDVKGDEIGQDTPLTTLCQPCLKQAVQRYRELPAEFDQITPDHFVDTPPSPPADEDDEPADADATPLEAVEPFTPDMGEPVASAGDSIVFPW